MGSTKTRGLGDFSVPLPGSIDRPPIGLAGPMMHPISRSPRWVLHPDGIWSLALFLASLLLFGVNLGGVPLRDWDEGTIAQVAKEIYQATSPLHHWLYPTLWGDPYLNKPPLLHGLIALTYSWGGIHEWTTRLPGAFLTALSVPLLYWVGRELFPLRTPAVLSALVYLTLLPVARHGRLAMLDGAVICFFLLMLGSALRSRRDIRFSWGVGVGFGLMVLTKGIVGLLLGAIAVLFMAWDTPRLLRSIAFWVGWLLGSLPASLWLSAQALQYGQTFFQHSVVNQSFQRVWSTVENNGGAPWYYLLELLEGGWPWLLFWPYGVGLAWVNRSLGWGKLMGVWTIVYFLTISCMGTKLPWYILPLYPVFALTVGVKLAEIWQQSDGWGGIRHTPLSYPRLWTIGCLILALGGLGGAIYFGFLSETSPDWDLVVVLVSVTLTCGSTAVLLIQRRVQFILVLLWGMYISLMGFMFSGHWVWELAEDYPVRPVAALIQAQVPPGQRVYTSHPIHRPSLDFYSEHPVIPLGIEELRSQWQNAPTPYLLIQPPVLAQLNLTGLSPRDRAEDWILLSPRDRVQITPNQ